MTPADFKPPMEVALGQFGINPKMPKGREIIEQHWNAFRGYEPVPWSKALESACRKHRDSRFFPTPNQVMACLDLIVPPTAKPKVEESEPDPAMTREEIEKSIAAAEKLGQKWLADMGRRRLRAMNELPG